MYIFQTFLFFGRLNFRTQLFHLLLTAEWIFNLSMCIIRFIQIAPVFVEKHLIQAFNMIIAYTAYT